MLFLIAEVLPQILFLYILLLKFAANMIFIDKHMKLSYNI